MGLFGGKKTGSKRDSSSGTSTAVTAADASDSKTATNTKSTNDKASASAKFTGAANTANQSKNQVQPSGSKSGRPSEDSTISASLDRGTAPRTGGKTVATIGKSIVIKGDLSGDEDLIIEGKVEGRVQLPNNEITVGADGRITADIEAKSIIVIGQTAGNLNASQRVEVQATGSVEGDITTPRLQIQEGASVNGSISMTKAPVAAGAKDAPAATPITGQERRSA
ncbi:MAG: cytoskeletal protein CcmA (bactofilin family) [Myxococcota bacterium]